jgi:4-amino-4-deoxy-L-arabinose transferase-like glycosyltransferase
MNLPFGGRSPERAALAIILVAFLFRLGLALTVGLGTDETYTVAIARELSLSYFDHPPLHQWIAHASTALLGEGPLARLPFVAMFAGTGWMLFFLTRRLFDAAAGVWAVAFLNLSAFFTVSAGSWILPDGPVLLALSVAAWALARRFFPLAGERETPWADWLIAGAALGLAGLAKYHAALAGLGAVAFILSSARGRAQLTSPAPWVAGALALAIVSPVILWNAQNDWASFAFQAARSDGGAFTPWLTPVSLLAQALWLFPWIAFVLVAGLIAAWKKGADARFRFLMAFAAPIIALFTLTPMGGDLGLPHWAMPGWMFVMPLAGARAADVAATRGRPARWITAATIGPALLLSAVASHAATGWLHKPFPALADADPTREAQGWHGLPEAIARTGLDPAGDLPILSDGWHTAGRIALAFGPGRTVAPGGDDPRHFAFQVDVRDLIGRDALVIVRAKREERMRAALRDHFATLGPSTPVRLGDGARGVALVAFRARTGTTPLDWPYGLAARAKAGTPRP